VLIGVVVEAALVVIYFVKPTLYDGLIVKILSWFSVIDRFDNFTLGILDVTALIYYLSLIVLFIFLTIQAIKRKRWN
jgi:ABC-2 type transport system permease protein